MCPVLVSGYNRGSVTWALSAAGTLLCSMASGSIFFLIARLLTVMVSAFTDYRNIKGMLTSKLKFGQNSFSQTTGMQEEKAFSHPHGRSGFWRSMQRHGCCHGETAQRDSQSHCLHEEDPSPHLRGCMSFEAVLGWLSSMLSVLLTRTLPTPFSHFM